jgi:type VI secretion system protein VasJ
MPAATAEPASATDVLNYLREVGTGIARAGQTLRKADPTDPVAYRLIRTGLWLSFSAAPPNQGGKTTVPPVPAERRAQFEKMAGAGKWPELLDETESAMTQYRLWLDIQRYSVQALSALGAPYARAKEAVLIEVASFLRRMPSVPDLSYSDGGAFADPQTKMWIETDVAAAPGGGKGGNGKSEDDGGLTDAIAEARGLMGKGQAGDAIAMVFAKVGTAANASSRFRARLALAKLCLQGSQLQVAKALYEGLEKDVTTHGLESWEPKLAAEVLEGFVTCLRSIAKGGKPLPPDAPLLYDRLCRIDPAAAAKMGA